VDLDGILTGVLEGLHDTMQAAGAKVVVDRLGSVRGDAAQLAVVLLNLIGNACKFTRRDASPVVHVRAADRPGARRVEVVDNGPGVPPEHTRSVFRLLERYSKGEGYGIGLSTVAVVVAAHGGTVGVVPKPDGPGSCFWFELPQGADAASA
jgi:signal transduction histidine kinase